MQTTPPLAALTGQRTPGSRIDIGPIRGGRNDIISIVYDSQQTGVCTTDSQRAARKVLTISRIEKS